MFQRRDLSARGRRQTLIRRVCHRKMEPVVMPGPRHDAVGVFRQILAQPQHDILRAGHYRPESAIVRFGQDSQRSLAIR
jgi:hypothetical protein